MSCAILYSWIEQQQIMGNVNVTSDQLLKLFPFWTPTQIKRHIDKLVKHEKITCLITEGVYTLAIYDKKKEKKEKSGKTYKYVYYDIDGNGKHVEKTEEATICDVIHQLVIRVNPLATKYYGWPSVKKSVRQLLSAYPAGLVFMVLSVLKETNSHQYAPVITTPNDLEKKLPQLLVYIKSNMLEDEETSAIIRMVSETKDEFKRRKKEAEAGSSIYKAITHINDNL